MTTIPAPVGRLARAACAMKRVPSLEVRRKSRDPAEPPAIGGIGGREALSTPIGAPWSQARRGRPGAHPPAPHNAALPLRARGPPWIPQGDAEAAPPSTGWARRCREHMICPLFVASDLSALHALASQSVGWEAQHALSAGGPGAGHDDS